MQDTDPPPAVREGTRKANLRTRKYRQAAAGYFVYGLIYLAGAIYLSTRDEGPQGGWIWFVVGAGMVLLFPLLIWKEMKWVTRILALLVAVRMVGLLRLIFEGSGRLVEIPGGGELPMVYGAIVFLVVAGIECYLLVRAGWDV